MSAAMSKRVRAPKEEPERQNRSRAVADLLPAVGGAAFRRFGFVQSAVVTRWPEIVGERLAAVSIPESIRFPAGKKEGGTLSLTVRGAHAAMMSHVTPEIMERVNRFFGYAAVAKVAIRQGEVTPRAPRRAPPSLAPAPVDLGRSLKTIADPELKAVLEALASGVAAPPAPPPVLPKVR
ncbi:DciA family protein [Sphingomonas corticis]|jgi:hypothetical protein|uniref:DUF721 domain-containing protein n=1 Tax=Sphingomonas corticis TaxID=2722791 RepID=A0ABX1CNN5_9SPHN|nr:DUF721 domain-containing protein [Sphingomonas corticis]